jgi:hypothetical protein
MRIRLANKFDQTEIFEMLRHYREKTPISMLADSNNEEHVSKLFRHITLGGGICLLAEDVDYQPIGLLIAVASTCMWDPDIRIMEELAYWVEPEYRGSTAGYRLLKEYQKIALKLKSENKIHWYSISKMSNSPDLKYEKFGYRKIEEKWIAGV